MFLKQHSYKPRSNSQSSTSSQSGTSQASDPPQKEATTTTTTTTTTTAGGPVSIAAAARRRVSRRSTLAMKIALAMILQEWLADQLGEWLCTVVAVCHIYASNKHAQSRQPISNPLSCIFLLENFR